MEAIYCAHSLLSPCVLDARKGLLQRRFRCRINILYAFGESLPRKDVFVTFPGVSIVLTNLHELANEVNGGDRRIKKCLSEKL